MARLLFELSGVRRRNGQLATGISYVVYSDEAGTVLADISATSGASATSTATVDADTSTVISADIAGLGPASLRYYGPDDVDTLYLGSSDTSLGVQKIGAATDPRLDTLEAGGGGSHPNLAVHDALGLATDAELSTHAADTTAIHGITDTSVLATTSGVASSIITHAAATDPHADRAYARAYADSVAQGLDVKLSVRVASTANLTLSGEQTIDGVLTSADRVLVKNQTAGATNGIYVSAAGAWSRATDADISAELSPGSFTFVEEGTVNGGTGWVQATPDPVVLDTTALVFTQFSGGGTIIGGAGLLKTGNTLDVGAGTGITVAADTVGIASGGVTNTQVSASAGIAESKLALNFPTHAVDHAARHAAAGADPLTGYVLTGDHTAAAHDALGLATDAELATHGADTTAVHGITDTTQLALKNAANTFTGIQTFDAAARFKNKPWYDVTHPAYGADASGVADSRAGIQAAIDAANVAGGGIVYMPAGTYVIESTIFVKTTTWLKGAGEGKTILKLKNGVNHDVIGKQAGALQYMTLSDFSIDGNRDNNTGGRGIVLDTMFVQCSIRNVNVYLTSGRGIYVYDADEFELRHVWVGNCDDTGIYLEDVSELRASDIAVERAHSTAAGAVQYVNLYLLRCDQTSIHGVGIEQTETLTAAQGRGVHFDSCTTFLLSGMYAYGIGGTGARDAAIRISDTDTPGRTYGYILESVTKNNYTKVFDDIVGTQSEVADHLRWYSDDFTPKTIQVRDGNLYLFNARIQGFTGGDLNINFGNAKTGATNWFNGTTSPIIETLAAGGFRFGGTASIRTGTGTPEGAVTAAIGSVFLRSDGSGGTSVYIKESGAGNTGWVAVAGTGSVATHEADTTSIHGITDTTQLALKNAANTFTANQRINGDLGFDLNPAATIDARDGVNFGNLALTPRPNTRGVNAIHGRAPLDADPEDIHGAMLIGSMTAARQSGAAPGAIFGIEAQAETLSGAGINPDLMCGVNALVNYRSDQTVANSRALAAQVQIDDASGTRAGTLTNAVAVYAEDVFEIGTLGTIVNSYGIYAKQQTKGSTLNIPIYSEGDICAAAAGRLGLGVTAFGGTVGNAIGLKAATTVPSSNVTNTHVIYVDPADNKLKTRGPSGTITPLANP